MDIIIGLLMGCGLSTVVGTGIYRKSLEKQRRSENVRLEKLRQELNLAHESELQQTIATLKTEYLQQTEAKERELKQNYREQSAEKERALQQEYEGQLTAKEQEYQQQLNAAIAAREEAEQSLIAQSREADATLDRLEEKHAREIAELKVKMATPPAAPPFSPQEVRESSPNTARETLQSPTNFWQLIDRTYEPNPYLRQQVALAIGKLVEGQTARSDIQRGIPVLGKLSRDPDSAVRLAAVNALAKINSREVLPYLQRALNDSDRATVFAASEAIAKYKRHTPKPIKPAPKNAAAQWNPEK